MTPDDALVGALRSIVGKAHLFATARQMEPYCRGMRFGRGASLAVVRPGSLVEMWRVVRACVYADVAILMQAANTGLTGGSTPASEGYDRPVVIISAMRIDRAHLIEGGRQVICLPGTTLFGLEALLDPLDREPHSVIGSSCIGASVMGGICNNSGGALVRRGPAYTEYALFAQRGEDGTLHLVNHLGVRLPGDPEEMLARLERGDFEIETEAAGQARAASDHDYPSRVRDLESGLPARFNADSGRLFEASGCAGKVALFAVRLDTFPKAERRKIFYIGTNDPSRLQAIRVDLLRSFAELPVSAEYIHRDCFDIAAEYGKDMFLALQWFGTRNMPALFKWKARLARFSEQIGLGSTAIERGLQLLSRLLPDHLPPRLRAFRLRFDHHLILDMADSGIDEARAYLASAIHAPDSGFFECTEPEGRKALLHRFVAAGAAIRYRAVHAAEVEDIVALDLALPRNTVEWTETLPPALAGQVLTTLYYGHFLCHVFHHDYIVRSGTDTHAFERGIWALLDARGARYPAEHNVGHLYRADPALEHFYRTLDPTNSFNPGIGQLSRQRDWH